ncbi:hypothetical protein ACFQYP_36510 [Nonomuraea antimicrobica]
MLSLVLLDPVAVTEVAQRNVPAPSILTPDGDRLGYAPVPRPYTGARRLAGVLLGRDPVAKTDVLCGGTVIGSRSRSLVLTAAHCLYHDGRLLKHLAFLPGFDQGRPRLGSGRSSVRGCRPGGAPGRTRRTCCRTTWAWSASYAASARWRP